MRYQEYGACQCAARVVDSIAEHTLQHAQHLRVDGLGRCIQMQGGVAQQVSSKDVSGKLLIGVMRIVATQNVAVELIVAPEKTSVENQTNRAQQDESAQHEAGSCSTFRKQQAAHADPQTDGGAVDICRPLGQ